MRLVVMMTLMQMTFLSSMNCEVCTMQIDECVCGSEPTIPADVGEVNFQELEINEEI